MCHSVSYCDLMHMLVFGRVGHMLCRLYTGPDHRLENMDQQMLAPFELVLAPVKNKCRPIYDICKSVIRGGRLIVNIPNPPCPLDVYPVSQIKVCTVYKKRLICT